MLPHSTENNGQNVETCYRKEKLFANYIWDRGLVSRMCIELKRIKHHESPQIIQSINGLIVWTDSLQMISYIWLINIWKDGQ